MKYGNLLMYAGVGLVGYFVYKDVKSDIGLGIDKISARLKPTSQLSTESPSGLFNDVEAGYNKLFKGKILYTPEQEELIRRNNIYQEQLEQQKRQNEQESMEIINRQLAEQQAKPVEERSKIFSQAGVYIPEMNTIIPTDEYWKNKDKYNSL